MLKEAFLRDEYNRIMASGEYVWSGWRDSYVRFRTDLWDMTPSGRCGRFLAAIDPGLGLAPGNVEWHYPQVRKAKAAKKVQVETRTKSWVKKAKKPKTLSPAQKRAAEKLRLQAEKQAKREALAAEFMKWERLRGNSAA
jgi:hypothetical protein